MDIATNMESDDITYTEKEVAKLLGDSGETPTSSPSAAMKVAEEAQLIEHGSPSYASPDGRDPEETAFSALLDAKIKNLEEQNTALLELAAKTMPKARTSLLSQSTAQKSSTSDKPSSGVTDGANPWIPVSSSSRGAKAKGEIRISSGAGHMAPGAETGNPKSTYAEKAKNQETPKEMVSHMLYVYATKLRKAPLAINDWKLIDDQLIDGLINDPDSINIAKSGYDSTYRCGYIACRDDNSAK